MNNRILLFIVLIAIPVSAFSSDLNNLENHKYRPYLLDSWGQEEPYLEITLPDKWKYEKYKGPDFDIHRLIDPDGNGKIAIYVGHNPNFTKKEGQSITKHFVGSREVLFYETRQDKKLLTEALVEDFFQGYKDSGVSSLKLHIMIIETNAGFTEKTFEYLKTLKIKKG
jgi:hypothetical protein